jgi:hypothetical protein
MRIAHKDLSSAVRNPDDGWIERIGRADVVILPAAQTLTIEGVATAEKIRSTAKKPVDIWLWVTISAAKPSMAPSLEYEQKRRKILLDWDHRYPKEWPGFAKRVDGAAAVAWQNAAGEQAYLVDPHDRNKLRKHADVFGVIASNLGLLYDGVVLDYVRDPVHGPWLNPVWNNSVTDLDMDRDGRVYTEDWTEQSAWWAWDVQNVEAFRKAIGENRALWVNGPLDTRKPWGAHLVKLVDGHYWELYEKLPYSNAISYFDEYVHVGEDLDALLEAVPGKPCAERDARVTDAIYQRPAGTFGDQNMVVLGGTSLST